MKFKLRNPRLSIPSNWVKFAELSKDYADLVRLEFGTEDEAMVFDGEDGEGIAGLTGFEKVEVKE